MFPVLGTRGRDNPNVSQGEGAAQECPLHLPEHEDRGLSPWQDMLEELKRDDGAVLQLVSM